MFLVETQGAVDVVKPGCPLNDDAVSRLQETLAGLAFAGQPMVVLDMSQVPLVDSAGLEALLDARDLLRESGGTLKLAAVSPLCADVLRIAGISQLFETYHDAKAAVRSFVR
jgi:anti-sigma B factor antagonist